MLGRAKKITVARLDANFSAHSGDNSGRLFVSSDHLCPVTTELDLQGEMSRSIFRLSAMPIELKIKESKVQLGCIRWKEFWTLESRVSKFVLGEVE